MPEVTVYYLEMTTPPDSADTVKPDSFDVFEAEVKQYQVNRFLYQFIGEEWSWFDKLSWSKEQWRSYSEVESLRTWVAYSQGSIAGYYELSRESEDSVEIAYFGLSPAFIGKGFGSYFLSHAIDNAWGWEGTRRVSVNTCTLDHASALPNYISRGFQIYKQTTDN
ncbi:MAG: GNAT family N-acetyltransferase [Halioglobus sp.]